MFSSSHNNYTVLNCYCQLIFRKSQIFFAFCLHETQENFAKRIVIFGFEYRLNDKRPARNMVGRLHVKRILFGWSSLIFRYVFLLHNSLSDDYFCDWTAEQMAAWPVGSPTAAPRESHPPASRWTLPIACDALNARTMAIREYLTFCASSPMRCQAHFAVRVGIAHFTEGHSVPTVRLGTEGMYLSAYMLRRSCLPGFLFCRITAG